MAASPFEKLVRAELDRARENHPGRQHSIHEAFGVLVEEVFEFFLEMCKKTRDRTNAATLGELVQIATMARRSAEDLGLVDE